MSYALDLNILLYATTHNPLQQRAVEFLAECARREEPLCLAWTTLMGYLRLTTGKVLLVTPLSLEQALENIEALVRLPHARLLSEREGFLDVYREVTQGLDVRGNLVPDAHLAALLYQHGVRVLYTRDADFRRFAFLDVRNPFGAA